MCRPARRLLVFALAVVTRGGPALNLDDWSYDALPWRAWSNDQADVESFYVTGARELYVEGELDAAGVVGLERTLDGVDLSPHAGIEVSYQLAYSRPGGLCVRDTTAGPWVSKCELPLAVELRLRSPTGDYGGVFAVTPRCEVFWQRTNCTNERVAFVGQFNNVTNVSSMDLRIMAQEGEFQILLQSIRAVSDVSDMEETSVNPAPIDGESPGEVAAYLDLTLERGSRLVEADLVGHANVVYTAAARGVAVALVPALPAPGPTQARNALIRGLEAAETSDDTEYIFGELHSALEAALFAASSATEDDFHGWPADDTSTTPWPSPLPWRDDDDGDGEKKYKTGFRFARCDGGSSRCILMIIYFVLLAASFCLCGFCLRDFCRQYWNRRKTIPYTDEDPVPGTVGDAAAPPDAVEDAATADEGA